ncbi:MAG: AAA family ATPase, partial [Fibrella sp.]|nr:AAA family ATPase [Armatimonadota bacterium]
MPEVVIIGGPNGAGKSTFARYVLPEAMPFLNADEIAKTLPEDFVGSRELESGRRLLERLSELARVKKSFALETTLASRSLVPRLRELQVQGYTAHLFFFYAPSSELCLARVAARVRRGGHDIPEATIRRRWRSGLLNFIKLYAPCVQEWSILRNTDTNPLQLVAN